MATESLKIEACRRMKSLLMKEARDRFPFEESKESTITTDKIKEYKRILDRLINVFEEEEGLWPDTGA